MGISKLLSEYGLIAVGFHFTVWVSTIILVFSLLNSGFELNGLPPFLSFLSPSTEEPGVVPDLTVIDALVFEAAEAADGALELLENGGGAELVTAKTEQFAAQMGATLAITEAIGPFRLALTAAVTPGLSGYARKFSVVREAEENLSLFIADAEAKFKKD